MDPSTPLTLVNRSESYREPVPRTVERTLGAMYFDGADSFKILTGTEGDDYPNAISKRVKGISDKVDVLAAKVDALAGALSDDEAKIIAAIRAQPTGGQVDVPTLAPALAAALAQIGTLVARVPEDQFNQLVAEIDKLPTATRELFAAALGRTP